MMKILCAVLLLGSAFSAYAGNSKKDVTVMVSSNTFTVEKVTFFRKGEGCIAGFKRLGYRVTVKTCVQAAEMAGLDIFWSNITEPPVIIPDVWEGQKFSVLSVAGKTTFVIKKR